MPRSKSFHALKKLGGGKIRQSWNKYNLYNLSRMTSFVKGNTHFQQKWKAKSTARAYHGEQLREKHWQRMFRPRINAEIPMDHRYLAQNDGSELAAGRGSGKEQDTKERKIAHIPYSTMTFAPLERRLDTAIFRALFASSTRQARQFVIHGKVKVNGKKMPYSGYLLNPGDMFSVDPESVLFATGAPKNPEAVQAGRQLKRLKKHEARTFTEEQQGFERRVQKAIEKKRLQAQEKLAENATAETTVQEEVEHLTDEQQLKKLRRRINNLIETAQILMRDPQKTASAKRKIELRAFIKEAKIASNKLRNKELKVAEQQIEELVTEFAQLTPSETTYQKSVEARQAEKKAETKATTDKKIEIEMKKRYEKSMEAILQARYTAVDETKPYATPWRPRPYMSPFAFIPRYLEVNQNICSAVYLRHPVVRPGKTEVPSPFAEDLQQLAFTWYLRRK